MATYAIGDIQGCYRTLKALVGKLPLKKRDQIWLAGDLVNRGPRSAKVLRWARDAENVSVVLGNHDLHLLAAAAGHREIKKRDTLEDVLEADDGEELCEWLAEQPFLVENDRALMVHAGIHPAWSLDEAREVAEECHAAVADGTWLKAWNATRPEPPVWSDDLTNKKRLASALSALVASRTFYKDGAQCVDFAGPLDERPKGTRPWFHKRDFAKTVYFGHWAALGFYRGDRVVCLDSGCVWGRKLTAVRIDDGEVFQQSNVD
jgi:bis(5'-nucleosyl)-tetraphosphatase (symmetrical)